MEAGWRESGEARRLRAVQGYSSSGYGGEKRRGRDRLQPSRASTETAGPRTVIGRRPALEALATYTYDPATDEDIRREL